MSGRHRAEPGEMTVGSLFTGYDGLGLAVEAVLGAKPLWFSENAPAPSRVLAYRWPEIPNLGDMTKIDWSGVPRVDIITGGFPCTDLSLAGRQEGMHAGTRSGLWAEMARAIETLRPQLIIAENVRGLLSGKAHSSVEQCPGCLDGAKSGHVRALGVVLSDLARIGYDAQWHGIRASEIGAPHQRFRVFVVAHLRDTDGSDRNRRRAAELPWQAGSAVGLPAPAESGTAADAHERLGDGWAGEPERLAAGGVAAGRDRLDVPADAGCEAVALGAGPGAGEPGGLGWSGSDDGDLPAADPGSAGLEGTVPPGGSDSGGRPGTGGGGQLAAGFGADVAADAQGDGRDEGLAESAGEFRGHDAAGGGDRDLPAADADLGGRQVGEERDGGSADGVDGALGIHADGRPGAQINWGQYGPAVQRWELITGRVAPAPTMIGPRGGQVLAPPFVEWMMGLEAGHVTDPAIGLTRSQQLAVLGNGVVPQQAAAALAMLLPLADEAAA